MMTFVHLPLLPHSEEGSKHTGTSTTRHTLHSLYQYTWLFSMVRDPCYVAGHEFIIMFCLLHKRCALQLRLSTIKVKLEFRNHWIIWLVSNILHLNTFMFYFCFI